LYLIGIFEMKMEFICRLGFCSYRYRWGTSVGLQENNNYGAIAVQMHFLLKKKILKRQLKKERNLSSTSRSLYTLAVIIIKFSSKFLKMQKMIFPIV